ncbi:MAG: uroporphyrinogen-III synthase [Bacteroidetes bacterium]|nr:uroporphyrinogen-III synthase [Bacteroidota bacterium]
MQKIFITRDLGADSIFYKTLTVNGFEVFGESLVCFRALPFGEVPPADWVFFYSKNAVRYFFAQVSPEAMPAVKWAAIGPGTAAVLSENGHPPDFTGDGDPVRAAAAFLASARGCRVLFPRAKESRQSVQRLLENQIVALDLVVYGNAPRTDFDLPDFDVPVFTSPLNVQAFFSKKSQKMGKIVAIGPSTGAALAALGIRDFVVAGEPSEEALAEVVLNIFLAGKR